jgi:hypothetical protein
LASALFAIGDRTGASFMAEFASVPDEELKGKSRVTFAHDLLCGHPLKHHPIGKIQQRQKHDPLAVVHQTDTINMTQMENNHVFVVWQLWIFDSNAEKALEWNDHNLAWCCDVDKEVFLMSGGLANCYCRYAQYKVPKPVIRRMSAWMVAGGFV